MKKVIFKREREVETNNYFQNKSYFENLFNVYKDLFIKQTNKYNLNYVIIDTNNLTKEEVLKKQFLS
ncbi:hypothetical protein NWQ33_00735 [Mycoplasmopsis cynos]|nr:hypothetical protein [Mycoplasmopsis cynos]